MDSSKVTRADDFWSCEKNDLRNCPTIDFFMFVNGLMTPEKIVFYESATFDESITLEDYVFCGPSMVFTNIFNPRAAIRKMDQVRNTLVKKGVTLGANCTIVCGNTIGQHAFIGAGAVVTRSVPDYALVAGNPSRQIGWVCVCGQKLSDDLACIYCAKQYHQTDNGLEDR